MGTMRGFDAAQAAYENREHPDFYAPEPDDDAELDGAGLIASLRTEELAEAIDELKRDVDKYRANAAHLAARNQALHDDLMKADAKVLELRYLEDRISSHAQMTLDAMRRVMERAKAAAIESGGLSDHIFAFYDGLLSGQAAGSRADCCFVFAHEATAELRKLSDPKYVATLKGAA